MTISLPNKETPLKIGTRGSPLALAQAHETRDRLRTAFSLPQDAFEIVVIRTTGDRVQDRPLKELGGKGLFTKEIEEALLSGAIDIAVHSMKDMPVLQPDGLALDTYLPREDVRDAFVSNRAGSIADLNEGAIVGTSSLRRRAQLLSKRPDLKVVDFRGNVQTRLRKIEEGVATATFLAVAGLNRLGMSELATSPIEPDDMLPAVAQGAIGIECRANDPLAGLLLEPLNHLETHIQVTAERAFLAALDGSCETPIAALAELQGDNVSLRGEILRPDGSERLAEHGTAPASEAAALGHKLGLKLLQAAPHGFFDWQG